MEAFNYNQFVSDIESKRFSIQKQRYMPIGLRELAKSIGVSAPTLSRILNGGKADLDTVILISRWLEKDLGDYILNSGKSEQQISSPKSNNLLISLLNLSL